MPRLVNRLINGRGRYGPGPDLQFAAFNDLAGGVRFDLKDYSAGRGGNEELLSTRNSSRSPEFPREHNAVGGIEFNRRFHAITVAW